MNNDHLINIINPTYGGMGSCTLRKFIRFEEDNVVLVREYINPVQSLKQIAATLILHDRGKNE